MAGQPFYRRRMKQKQAKRRKAAHIDWLPASAVVYRSQCL
jgi:hypothetical protein